MLINQQGLEMSDIETIYVNRNGEKVLINKADLNPDIEKKWVEPKPASVAKK